ncbi:MAG: response regulator transcription factor [Paludibaculum sp.]
MKRLSEVEAQPRNMHAIVCLESSVELWKRLRRLTDGLDVASEFILARSQGSSSELIALCRRLAPALVMIEDSRLSEVPLKDLHELIPNGGVHVVVVSDKVDQGAYESFFRQGCAGVLPRDVNDETLFRAIQAIFAGELWFPRKTLSRMVRDTLSKGNTRHLTRRESEVFEFIRQGLTNQQIADELFLSRETVRWHVRSLYSKIGVKNRSSAIREYELYQTKADESGKMRDADQDEDE